MSELKINPNEIRDALKDFVSSYEPKGADKAEVGYVTDFCLVRTLGLIGRNEVLQGIPNLIRVDL